MSDYDRTRDRARRRDDAAGDATNAPVPGKRTGVYTPPIAAPAAEGDLAVAAARGVAGASGALPHLTTIQRAFGRHDVSGVRAHVGGPATEAASDMGAEAYAMGDAVAFAGDPDLRVAAHEAAHVVQQRGGVQLSGGVGRTGDPYERHADEVADAVVRGESAEALLDRYAPATSGSGGGGGGAAVQMWNPNGARAASSRPGLQAAVQRVEDLAQLEGIRAAVLAIGETPQDGRPASIAIAQTEHAVRAADVGWLLGVVDDRIAAVRAAGPDLVDRTVDRRPPEREAEPAAAPSAPTGHDGLGRGIELGTFQYRREWSVGVGTLTLEVGVAVQLRDRGAQPNGDAAPAQTTMTAATSGGRTQGAGSVTLSAAVPAIEAYLDTELASRIGRDHVEIERRNGRYEGELGWHLGSTRIGGWDVGFRFNVATLGGGEAPRFASLTFPIASPWLPVGDHVAAQLTGEITFQPSIPAVMRLLQSRLAIVEGAAEARAASTAARAAPSAATELAVGVAMWAGIALVASAIVVSVVGLAVAGVGLLVPALVGAPNRRREEDPRSDVEIDPELTRTGTELHRRVGGFCAAYAATMRGEPAGGDPAQDAGRQAATRWIRDLEAQGHTVEDIHAAARSAPDLASRVLAATRDAFVREADGIVVAAFRGASGQGGAGVNQRREWASRYLRSCITLAPCPRAAPFDFDACRELPDARGDVRDAHGARVDGHTCPPGGESNPDEAPPAPERHAPPWTL
jgi:hypothetical protein